MDFNDKLPRGVDHLLHQEHDTRPPPLPRTEWVKKENYLSARLIKGAEDFIAEKAPAAALVAILAADQMLACLWVYTEGSAQQEILLGHARTLRRLYLQAEALEEGGLRE